MRAAAPACAMGRSSIATMGPGSGLGCRLRPGHRRGLWNRCDDLRRSRGLLRLLLLSRHRRLAVRLRGTPDRSDAKDRPARTQKEHHTQCNERDCIRRRTQRDRHRSRCMRRLPRIDRRRDVARRRRRCVDRETEEPGVSDVRRFALRALGRAAAPSRIPGVCARATAVFTSLGHRTRLVRGLRQAASSSRRIRSLLSWSSQSIRAGSAMSRAAPSVIDAFARNADRVR